MQATLLVYCNCNCNFNCNAPQTLAYATDTRLSHNMVSFSFTSALAAAAMLMTVSAQSSDDFWSTVTTPTAVASPTTTIAANAMETIGCFETGTPLVNYGTYKFQSPGNCQFVCLEHGKNILGLSNGIDCWCGDKVPAQDWKVDNSSCTTTCSGTKLENCMSPTTDGLLDFQLTFDRRWSQQDLGHVHRKKS